MLSLKLTHEGNNWMYKYIFIEAIYIKGSIYGIHVVIKNPGVRVKFARYVQSVGIFSIR
jgi:hypothetical protein